MNDEPEHVLAAGIERWDCAVVQRQTQERWVALELHWVAEAEGELPIVQVIVDPATAREMGEALLHYAGLADARQTGEQN